MTVATAQLSESLQTLIDSRLDTIDRMLLGRVSRKDRLAIAREAESQIHELLQERDTDELTRDDVLAVLARLDPPEAYIPDGTEAVAAPGRVSLTSRSSSALPKAGQRIARASGILGLTALVFTLLMPVGHLIAKALGSEAVFIIGAGGSLLLMFINDSTGG